MNSKYVLNDKGEPKEEKDLFAWAQWFEKSSRVVKRESIGNSEISTVFLGINHQYNPEGPPILWETMVFGGSLDQEQDRCSGNREQAEAMHAAMVKRVKECNDFVI